MALLENHFKSQFPRLFIALICFMSLQTSIKAQCDCAYPVLFVHGWTGDYTSWDPLYTDADFMSAWGGLTDRFDAVLNATTQSNAFGVDGAALTSDDDALFQFVNDPNDLLPGCVYAVDFDWFWNLDPANPGLNLNNPPNGESDSNQSAIEKQGWAVGQAIKAILQANPTKSKVIIAGHSMGGLAGREYLQRFENGTHTWWVDPSDPINGHKVAKLITTGTPHRGSNASLGNLGSILNFDETSEAVRDLRFSYSTGIFGPRDPAPYLFFGPEDDHVDDSYFKSADVDCDGDYDTNLISSLNVAGSGDAWDGTYDNPSMPLPTNVKYSYYTSYSAQDITLLQFNGGDGVVADERQWIYSGGNGSTGDYQNGSSVPEPSDGVDYRLSERVHSANNVFHTSQTGDVDDILRVMDEADYPFFAYEILTGIDYSGFASIRADFVPTDSEYTGTADNTVDGDWYWFDINANTPGLDVTVTPHSSHSGRVDVYTVAPTDYDNANAPVHSMTWGAGAGQQILNVSGMCLAAGKYYLRITHDGLTTSSWREPYKMRIDELPCETPTGLSASVTALTAVLNWTPMLCATSYEITYREIGSPIGAFNIVTNNSFSVSGLLPDTDYEFFVSTDCGSGLTAVSAAMPFSTTDCPSVLYIPSEPALSYVPAGIYNVDQIITSDGTIDAAANVTYYAGTSVELLEDFEVKLGADFLADIQNCVGTPLRADMYAIKKVDLQEQPLLIDEHEKVEQSSDDQFFIRSIPQADGTVLVQYNDPNHQIEKIRLLNQDQKELQQYETDRHKKSSSRQLVIDKKIMAPGKYLVEFNVGGKLKHLKLVKRPEGEEFRSRN